MQLNLLDAIASEFMNGYGCRVYPRNPGCYFFLVQKLGVPLMWEVYIDNHSLMLRNNYDTAFRSNIAIDLNDPNFFTAAIDFINKNSRLVR